MAHKVNGTFQTKALVSGLNTVVASYTLAETASGSTTIAIAGLPAGAQIVSTMAKINHAAIQDGALGGSLRVDAKIGTTVAAALLATSTANTTFSVGTGTGHGTRLTASANLIVTLADIGGATGTANTVFTVICTYLSELSGD